MAAKLARNPKIALLLKHPVLDITFLKRAVQFRCNYKTLDTQYLKKAQIIKSEESKFLSLDVNGNIILQLAMKIY